MALWSGRIAGTMSHAMTLANTSLYVDIRLLPFDLTLNSVWAHELHRIKILSADELKALTDALAQITTESESPDFFALIADCTDEDVHSYVERRLTEIAGDAGRKIHTGRSRNDQVATDLRLCLKQEIQGLQGDIGALVGAITTQAKAHQETILPGYTHLQQAQPISLAHYLLSAGSVLRDDFYRLDDALHRLDRCPLGSGALAGSGYPIDRTAIAKALGFREATSNSIAAVSMRDECLEVAAAAATLMTHLSRYAEDWIIWSSHEFRFLALDDRVSTGSSMMPQKKNPDALELIRGKSARVIGQMQTLFTLMKALPLTYARDLQEDKPAIFDILDQTALSLNLMTDVVESSIFNPERMFLALDASLYATELADYLTLKGVPFRTAHAMVGGLVHAAEQEKKSLNQLSAPQMVKMLGPKFATYRDLFQPDIRQCFDPKIALARRNLRGGTGPESVESQISDLERWIRPHRT